MMTAENRVLIGTPGTGQHALTKTAQPERNTCCSHTQPLDQVSSCHGLTPHSRFAQTQQGPCLVDPEGFAANAVGLLKQFALFGQRMALQYFSIQIIQRIARGSLLDLLRQRPGSIDHQRLIETGQRLNRGNALGAVDNAFFARSCAKGFQRGSSMFLRSKYTLRRLISSPSASLPCSVCSPYNPGCSKPEAFNTKS